MPQLFIRVLSEANALPEGEGYAIGVEWLIKEDDGTVRGSGVTDYRGLGDIADPNVEWLSDPLRTIVLIPSQMVLMVTCEVPGRSAAQIKRALPFAVEEFVATDIERMHIAPGVIKAGAPIVCSIIEQSVLANWLACFRSLGIEPGYCIADAQLLVTQQDTASVLFDGDGALVATSDQAAMVDRGTLVFALNAVAPQRVIVVNGTLTGLEISQLEGDPSVEGVELSEFGVLDYLADHFRPSACINLLQGEFTPQKRRNPHAGKWLSVAALAALWVVVGFASTVVQGMWSSSEADRLEQESMAMFKQFAPRDTQPPTVERLRRQVSNRLGEDLDTGGGGGGFVHLTAQFANVLDPSARVSSLRYLAKTDEVTVEVMLQNYEELEVIQSKLSGSSVKIEVVNAEEEGGKIRSRLRVKDASS